MRLSARWSWSQRRPRSIGVVPGTAGAASVSAQLTGVNGDGSFADRLDCGAENGAGDTWRYAWQNQLASDVSGVLAGRWNGSFEVHRAARGAFVPAGDGHLSLAVAAPGGQVGHGVLRYGAAAARARTRRSRSPRSSPPIPRHSRCPGSLPVVATGGARRAARPDGQRHGEPHARAHAGRRQRGEHRPRGRSRRARPRARRRRRIRALGEPHGLPPAPAHGVGEPRATLPPRAMRSRRGSRPSPEGRSTACRRRRRRCPPARRRRSRSSCATRAPVTATRSECRSRRRMACSRRSRRPRARSRSRPPCSPRSVPTGMSTARARKASLGAFAAVLVAGAIHALTAGAAIPIPVPDAIVVVTTKSGNVTKTHLVPIGGAPIPIDVDGPTLLGVLEPDIDVSVGLVAIDELPGKPIVPNVVVTRDPLAVTLNRPAPPIDFDARVILRDAADALRPFVTVHYGFETPPGARMPQVLSAKLVGPITSGFVDPLQAKIDTPGYSGPLKLKISALTHDLDAKFALDFDALPEAIFISEDPREDGLDVLYEHNAPVADVHLDATASLRNRDTNELLDVDAQIERLPQRDPLSNTNTARQTDVAYESSSTISNPDVSARYRDLDGERRRRHRREARHRGPAAEDGRHDHVGPQRRGRLGHRRGRLPRRRGRADRRRRLRGAQLRRAVAGARAGAQPRAAHRVREPLRRRAGRVRAPPAACWASARRSSSARAPTNDIVDADTDLGDGVRPLRALIDIDNRADPEVADDDDQRIAIDTTLAPLPEQHPRDLQAVGRLRRPAAAALTSRRAAWTSTRRRSSRRDRRRLRPGRGDVREGAHRRRPDAAGGAAARRGRDGLRPPPQRRRRDAASRRQRGDRRDERRGRADVGRRAHRPRSHRRSTGGWTRQRGAALRGVPRLRLRLHALRQRLRHARRGGGARARALHRPRPPERGTLPPREDTAKQFVSLISRDERFEATGRVDEVRNVAFHQRDDDDDGEADGTLGALVDAGTRRRVRRGHRRRLRRPGPRRHDRAVHRARQGLDEDAHRRRRAAADVLGLRARERRRHAGAGPGQPVAGPAAGAVRPRRRPRPLLAASSP